MIANAVSGEVEIILGGESYVLRPSWEAMLAIEEQIGSLVGLARKFSDSNGGPRVREMAVIITETIRAAGREKKNLMWANYGLEKITEMVAREGPMNFMKPTLALLSNMLSGGSAPTKKKVEEAQTGSTIAG